VADRDIVSDRDIVADIETTHLLNTKEKCYSFNHLTR
jgi:hypothetical protein